MFALQYAKKLNSQLIDQISEPESKKKDAFKNSTHKKESLLTLVLMGVQQASAFVSLSQLVQQTCSEYFTATAKEKVAERKAEL